MSLRYWKLRRDFPEGVFSIQSTHLKWLSRHRHLFVIHIAFFFCTFFRIATTQKRLSLTSDTTEVAHGTSLPRHIVTLTHHRSVLYTFSDARGQSRCATAAGAPLCCIRKRTTRSDSWGDIGLWASCHVHIMESVSYETVCRTGPLVTTPQIEETEYVLWDQWRNRYSAVFWTWCRV